MNFTYETTEEGRVVKGNITASSKEEALRSLAKMGTHPSSIGEEGGEMEKISPPDSGTADNMTSSPSPKRTIIAADDGEDDYEGPTEEQLATVLGKNATKAMEKQPAPIAWPKVPMPEPSKPPKPDVIDVIRRQTVLCGKFSEINPHIIRLLSLYGEVKMMTLEPDMRGNMVMAIVIEHDVPVDKPKPKENEEVDE